VLAVVAVALVATLEFGTWLLLLDTFLNELGCEKRSWWPCPTPTSLLMPSTLLVNFSLPY